ncbi:MAG: hypothetical protein DLM64_06095 [Solirubrobacterales bacterium]|nr:MAG: hypothetical protein DLM64_06095 [Solirubrobacterales bacterium]
MLRAAGADGRVGELKAKAGHAPRQTGEPSKADGERPARWFEELREFYGSDEQAAEHVGLTHRVFTDVRTRQYGSVNIDLLDRATLHFDGPAGLARTLDDLAPIELMVAA